MKDYPSKPLVILVYPYWEPRGYHHRAAKAKGAPWAGLRTLCGIPVEDLRPGAPYSLFKDRPVLDAVVPADPFYGPRGCPECSDRLSI